VDIFWGIVFWGFGEAAASSWVKPFDTLKHAFRIAE